MLQFKPRTCVLLLFICIASIPFASESSTLSTQASLEQPTLIPTAPGLPVKAYALIDPSTQQVIAQKAGRKHLEIASLTKLMSLYIIHDALAAKQINADDRVRISHKAWHIEGSRMFLKEGEYTTVDKLIQGVIVTSGNDATIALAEHLAGNEATFVKLMNQTSQSLHMTDSLFENATGLPSPNNHASAIDLGHLSAALIDRFDEYYPYYQQKWLTYNKIKQPNRNRLLWSDKSVDGLKTGHTKEAGYCLVASAKRHGTRLIAVIIGAKSDYARFTAAESLLNYGFRYFQSRLILKKHHPLTQTKLWKGQKNSLPLGITDDLYVTVTRHQNKHLKIAINVKHNITAPIQDGDVYGTLNILDSHHIIATRPLIALKSIPAANGLMQLITPIYMKFSQLFAKTPETLVLPVKP